MHDKNLKTCIVKKCLLWWLVEIFSSLTITVFIYAVF